MGSYGVYQSSVLAGGLAWPNPGTCIAAGPAVCAALHSADSGLRYTNIISAAVRRPLSLQPCHHPQQQPLSQPAVLTCPDTECRLFQCPDRGCNMAESGRGVADLLTVAQGRGHMLNPRPQTVNPQS